jgi:DNA-binding CsgD family transcriptional regulator
VRLTSEAASERVGYLLKDRVSDIAVLADALKRIGEGECVIDPTIVSRLVNRPREGSPLDELTEREREVLALMAEGRSNGAICQTLFLSPKTIEANVRQIFRKLELQQSPDDHRRVSRCSPTSEKPRSGLLIQALVLPALRPLQVGCGNVAGDVGALQALCPKPLHRGGSALERTSGSHPGGRRFESG